MIRRIRVKHVLVALGFACLVVPPLVILYFVYLFDWNSTRDRVSEAASARAARKIVIDEAAIWEKVVKEAGVKVE